MKKRSRINIGFGVVPVVEPLYLLIDQLVLLAFEVLLSSQLLHVQFRQLHNASLPE